MWSEVSERYASEPAKQEVIKFILERGYSVDEELGIHSDGIKLQNSEIAVAIGVDRRTVNKTVESILDDDEIRTVFENLTSIPFLREAAPVLDLHVIEVQVSDAEETGLLSKLSQVFADNDVLVRQAIVEDPYFSDQPTFIAIIENFENELITDLKTMDFVETVVYT